MSMFTHISPVTTPFTDENISSFNNTHSVEQRVRDTFANYSVNANREKEAIIDQANNGDATNPAELLKLQNRVGNYSLAINMVSTLTHKTASAIDTVLKAQ